MNITGSFNTRVMSNDNALLTTPTGTFYQEFSSNSTMGNISFAGTDKPFYKMHFDASRSWTGEIDYILW